MFFGFGGSWNILMKIMTKIIIDLMMKIIMKITLIKWIIKYDGGMSENIVLVFSVLYLSK